MKSLYFLAAAPLLFAACAHVSTPPPTARATPAECARLAASLDDALERQAAAERQAKEAYKAVVPVAVVAIYAQNASDGADAARQAENLQSLRVSMGCVSR
jgi:hypothetical protein